MKGCGGWDSRCGESGADILFQPIVEMTGQLKMQFERKAMFIQRYLTLMIFVCLAFPVWSADDKVEPPVEKRPEKEPLQTQSQEGKNPQPLRTPRKFTPSEEISADSAVSFPVDI